MATWIFKVCPRDLWADAQATGVFLGAPIDLADGFIHFSTAEQVKETVRLHFKGRDDLMLVGVDARSLGDRLRFEPSRGGERFPHLYGPLPLSAVGWVKPLPLIGEVHVFPDLS